MRPLSFMQGALTWLIWGADKLCIGFRQRDGPCLRQLRATSSPQPSGQIHKRIEGKCPAQHDNFWDNGAGA